MRKWLSGLLLILALVQFVTTALPPGNADLISVQSLALDLKRGDPSLLYPGRDFVNNDAWVQHHEANMRRLGEKGDPNWCFYPPLVPLVVSPVADASPESWRILWGLLQLGLIALFALLIERLLRLNEDKSVNRLLLGALLLGSYPLAQAIALGQTSLLVALILWTGIYASLQNRRFTAALAIGIAAFFKPFVLLVELTDLFRRRFHTVLWVGAAFAGLLILSLLAVGIRPHIEYWNLLSTLGSSQTAYAGNQSLLAGIVRFTTGLSVLDYGFYQDPGLAVLGRLIALAVIATAAHFVFHSRGVPVLASTGLWLSASMLALPISWEHHIILLLPVLAWLWLRDWNRAGWIALAVATALLEIRWQPFYAETFAGRVFASFPLFGNLILFVILVTVHNRSRVCPAGA